MMRNPYNISKGKQKKPNYLFDFKKEYRGKKYKFCGEYPYDNMFLKQIRKLFDKNGFDVHLQFRKNDNTVVVWTRKKYGTQER